MVHRFGTWVHSPAVLPVLQAAGRRFGLGEDLAEERRGRLQKLVVPTRSASNKPFLWQMPFLFEKINALHTGAPLQP